MSANTAISAQTPKTVERLALGGDAARQAKLDELATEAERQAAKKLRMPEVRLDLSTRHRFDLLVQDAEVWLRAVPVKEPSDPARAAEWRAAVREARRLSTRPKALRAELLRIARQLRAMRANGWDLARARRMESEPAIMAFAVNGDGFRIVRDRQFPPAITLARALERRASQMRGAPGRRHQVDANFDVAVRLLLSAFALATGETGRAVLASGLSAPPGLADAPVQEDAGPRATFVRAAVAALAPDVAQLMGGQAVTSAVRRLRDLDTQAGRAETPTITG